MAKDKMDLQITLTGKLKGVSTDDIEKIKAQSSADIATILFREGSEIKIDVREVYVKREK